MLGFSFRVRIHLKSLGLGFKFDKFKSASLGAHGEEEHRDLVNNENASLRFDVFSFKGKNY